MFKRRKKKLSLLGTIYLQIQRVCSHFFPGNLPGSTVSTFVLRSPGGTGPSSCAVAVFTFFTAYFVVTSSSASRTSSQSLNLGILVAESCDTTLTAKIDQLASKAFGDVRRQILQETGSASTTLSFSSTTYLFCEVRTVVKNLDDIFANGSIHAVLVLASSDLHASLVTIAEIYSKAYIPLNNYLILSPDTMALSLAPSFDQQASIMARVLDRYQWQNVYVIYTNFKSFADFAVFFYITMTFSKFNVTLGPSLQSPVSDADAARTLQLAGGTKVYRKYTRCHSGFIPGRKCHTAGRGRDSLLAVTAGCWLGLIPPTSASLCVGHFVFNRI
ncbi:hypothetical protein Btru_029510 [Bulinus truncatus]|nr:hypothetical protein Btru_029510 [Bulinus truncatus]